MVHNSFFKHYTEEQLNKVANQLLKSTSFDCLSWECVGPLLESPCISVGGNSASAFFYGDSYRIERKPLTVAITEAFIVEKTLNGQELQQNN